MSRESDLYKDKIEVSLDGRQIFYLFFGGTVIVGLVFVLGVMVGRRVEARGHVDRARVGAAVDPLAALDRLEGGTGLSFQGALRGGDAPASDVDKAIASMQKADKAKADGKHGDAKLDPKQADDKKLDAKGDAVKGDAAKADAAKGDAAKADAAKADAAKLEAAKLDAKKLDAAKLDAAKLDAAKLEAAKLDAKKLDAAKGDAAKGDAAKLDAAKLDAAKLDAKKLDAAKLDAKKLESEKKAEDKKLEAAKLDVKKVDDKKLDADKKLEGDKKPKFTLQLSSFQNRSEAQQYLDAIKSAGFQGYLTEGAVDGKQYFRVRLGSYKSMDAANEAKSEYEKASKKSAIVIKLL